MGFEGLASRFSPYQLVAVFTRARAARLRPALALGPDTTKRVCARHASQLTALYHWKSGLFGPGHTVIGKDP